MDWARGVDMYMCVFIELRNLALSRYSIYMLLVLILPREGLLLIVRAAAGGGGGGGRSCLSTSLCKTRQGIHCTLFSSVPLFSFSPVILRSRVPSSCFFLMLIRVTITWIDGPNKKSVTEKIGLLGNVGEGHDQRGGVLQRQVKM